MRKFKFFIHFLIIVSFSNLASGQEIQRNFSDILQTYYLNKDKDVVEKTIVFLNNPKSDYNRFEPILTGFYGALFSIDTAIKNDFFLNLNRLEKSEFVQLFIFLNATNIDSIYSKTPLSPAYNDMNWSSYFATGDVKFLNKIIANIHHAENRIDRNLFVTGATAKWSLCSNAKQDKQVKEHLTTLKDNKKIIKAILKRDPHEFKQEMTDVIIKQRANGLWN